MSHDLEATSADIPGDSGSDIASYSDLAPVLAPDEQTAEAVGASA